LTAWTQVAKSGADFHKQRLKDISVAKPELGTKRLCASCGAKFYDLNHDPITCPKCGTVFQVTATTRGRAEPIAARAAMAPAAEAEPEAAEAAELVSLEEADAETEGAKKSTVADADDVDVDGDDDAADDDTFLEPDEDEGDDDVTDIIGGDIEPEEET
jgi:uncharacterized protein (TIGR02300 family)